MNPHDAIADRLLAWLPRLDHHFKKRSEPTDGAGPGSTAVSRPFAPVAPAGLPETAEDVAGSSEPENVRALRGPDPVPFAEAARVSPTEPVKESSASLTAESPREAAGDPPVVPIVADFRLGFEAVATPSRAEPLESAGVFQDRPAAMITTPRANPEADLFAASADATPPTPLVRARRTTTESGVGAPSPVVADASGTFAMSPTFPDLSAAPDPFATAGGLDLSRTNELLEQILQESRRRGASSLPIAGPSDSWGR